MLNLFRNSKFGRCVSLILCCFVVYSTRRLVSSLAMCYFILMFFNQHCDYLAWEDRANFSASRTFVRFAVVWFCLFPLPLRSGKGCGL